MVRVTAANVGEARANADADEQGTNRTTVEVSSKAQATGISTGDGINQITNRGTIVVSAAPRAVLEALSDSGFIDSKNYNSRFTDTTVLRLKKALNWGVVHNSHITFPIFSTILLQHDILSRIDSLRNVGIYNMLLEVSCPFREPFPCTGRYLLCALEWGIGIEYRYISEKGFLVAIEPESLQSLRFSTAIEQSACDVRKVRIKSDTTA